MIEARGLMIDPSSYRVTHDGKPVTLSTLEFRLLYYLATRPNRVFTRDQLLDAVWGTERFVTPRSVDVYIRRLREKVENDADHPAFLKTVRGAGYMFESAAQSVKTGVNTAVRVSLFWRLGLTYLALVAAILIAVEVDRAGNHDADFARPRWSSCLQRGSRHFYFLRSTTSRIRRLKEFADRAAAGDFTPLVRDHGNDRARGPCRRPGRDRCATRTDDSHAHR